MLFVLYGTERLLMDQRLQKLKKEYQCSQELMNYNSYDVSKEGMKVVLEDVMTPSFLSEQKMIVINHCDFLTTKKLKKENKDADYLLWNGNRPQIKRKKFEQFIDCLSMV